MFYVHAIGMVSTAILFGVVGYYFTLIAKFYRQKFSKGPPYQYFQLSLIVLILGLALSVKPLAFIPGFLPSALICLGGIGFSLMALLLYRTMMSVG